jgi:hypothetical protein
MKKRTTYLALMSLAIMIVASGIVFATSCGGGSTSCSLTASTEIGNTAPTITIVDVGVSAVTLTAGTTTNFDMWFVASDINGVADLNDATALARVTKAGDSATPISSSCTPSDLNTTAANYSCTLVFPFHAGAGSWDVHVEVNDTTNQQATDDTETVTVNALDALDYSNAISFTGLTAGTNNNEGSAVTFTNKGNGVYTTVEFTAYDAVNGLNTIGAGQYSIETTTAQCPGDTGINATAVAITSSTLPKGASATEVIFPCVNVPNGLPAATYNAESNWVFAFS